MLYGIHLAVCLSIYLSYSGILLLNTRIAKHIGIAMFVINKRRDNMSMLLWQCTHELSLVCQLCTMDVDFTYSMLLKIHCVREYTLDSMSVMLLITIYFSILVFVCVCVLYIHSLLCCSCTLYTVNHKKRDILFLTITLANHNRFL